MQSDLVNELCYHVFYTKNINKKKKTYSEGILLFTSASTKLYSSEGLLLTNAKNKSKEKPQIDEQYVLNNSFLVLIDREGKIQNFKSGKIFFAETPEPTIVKQKNNKKKMVSKSKHQQLQTVQLESGLRVEKALFEKLKQHQIQGINFMYQCLNGSKGPSINGCILADYMGLGKTLQTLALSYSMIKLGAIKKFVVVCPLTLLSVWEKQTQKWLGNKIHPLTCFGNNGQQNLKIVNSFAQNSYRMLIISYETFYKNIEKISGKCDMIVFDEGHRLKNKKSKLLLKLRVFRCQKRILLTGTPIQNNLQQLYTCVSIINPHLFGNESVFKNIFEKPILQGMSKKATSAQKQLAEQRTLELSHKLKQFSIRRNTDILEKYLPLKNEYLIFLQLTSLQKQWYKKIIQMISKIGTGKQDGEGPKKVQDDMFKTLNYLRKLFTHPLILKSKKLSLGQCTNFLQHCENQTSPKVQLTIDITKLKVTKLNKKVVIVSYYTETLDFIAEKLKLQNLPYARLDGKMKSSERKNSLLKFQQQGIPILLLSGKAGGTGLTLTCATTMILMEPDWNPANDAQVMARIWRQGQTSQVEIFRLIIACSFEQKMLQRQGIKSSLAATLIDDQKNESNNVDYESLGQLFIDNREQVLSYRQQENSLDEFIEKYRQTCQNHGIIFVKQKLSHDKDGKLNQQKQIKNEFESINLLSIKNEKKQENGKEQESDEQFGISEREEKNEDSLDPTEYDSDSSVTESEQLKDEQMQRIGSIQINRIMEKQSTEEKRQEQVEQKLQMMQSDSVSKEKESQNEGQDSLQVKQVNRFRNGKREVEDLEPRQKPRTNILCKIKNRKI